MSDSLIKKDLQEIDFPEHRFINSASVANRIISSAISSHARYWQVIRDADQHIGGKKPMNPKALQEANLAWSANYNYGKARAKIEQGTTENVGELMRSLAMLGLEFRRIKDSDKDKPILQFLEDDILRDYVGEHCATTFVDALFNDSRFLDYMTKIVYMSYSYGVCAVACEGDFDYLGMPAHPLSIAFEDKSRVDDIKTWMIFDIIKADKLWRIWNDIKDDQNDRIERGESGEKQSFRKHWILEGIEDVLWRHYRGLVTDKKNGQERKVSCWDEVYQEYQKNSSEVISNTDNVRIAKIWNRELDNTYTETYAVYNSINTTAATPTSSLGNSVTASKSGSPEVTEHLLYQRNWGEIKASDKISFIRDSAISPESYIQDYRGVVKFAAEDSKRYDRNRNSLDDKLLLSGSPVIVMPSGQVAERFKLGVHKGFTLMGQGYQFAPNQPRQDLQSHILSMQFHEQEYQRETLQFDSKVIGKLSSRPTSDEVNTIGSDAARSADAKLNIMFSDWGLKLIVMLKRITKMKPKDNTLAHEIKEFFYSELRWKLDGILQEKDEDGKNEEISQIIDAIISVKVDRIIRDTEALQLSLRLAETPFEIRRLERMMLLSLGHPRREVNKLKPPLFQQKSSFQDERTAAMENDMFWRTSEVVYNATDNPVIHLDIHFSKTNRVFEMVREQTLDPIEAFNFGRNCLSHSSKHLEKLNGHLFLGRFYNRYAESMSFLLDQLQQVKAIGEAMAKEIKRRQETGEGGQPQIDPEKLAKIQTLQLESQKKEERKDFLTKAEFQRREESFQRDQDRKDRESSAKINRDSVEAQVNIKLKELESQSNNQ